MQRLIRTSAAGLSLALAMSCAPDIGTVDRTQPNIIDKSMFEGIWYYRSAITESAPEAGVTEGITSNMEKIRWDIQESRIIGYRSYEFVPYAEGLDDEGRDFFGAPVVAFAILSHFDVQRGYNATTGIQDNTIVENTTDRPWFERRYMRVDWTNNIVGQPTIFGWGAYPDGYLNGTPLKYYVQGDRETDIDRPMFTENYFDVTNIYSIGANPFYCSYMLLRNQVPRCGSGDVRVRQSFMKVNPADDYESLYYPDEVELKDNEGNALIVNFDGRECDAFRDPGECTVQTYAYDGRFGNFRIQRVAFDRERYLTRTGRIYMAGRFNLWKDSYNDADGSLIPYDQREAKPVIYYGNVQFPDEMLEPAVRMAKAFDAPFSEVIAFRKGYFTADGRPDIEKVHQEVGGDMYQFRQNDCNVANIVRYAQEQGYGEVLERIAGGPDRVAIGNVEQVCSAVQFAELQDGKTLDPAIAAKGEVGLAFQWQRKGDLRYNHQNYIHQLQFFGPWGVAQFGQDPETGEFVGGNTANYFSDAGDIISGREVDVIQWLNGDLDSETLLRGEATRTDVISRRSVGNNRIRQSVKRMLAAHEDSVIADSGDSLFGQGTADEEDRRFERMWGGTEIERELLVDEEILRGFAGPTLYQPFGAPPAPSAAQANGQPTIPGNVSPTAMDAASPVSWGMTPATNPYMNHAYEFGRRGWDMADFFDITTSGLADFFKGSSRDEIYQWIRKEMYAAVNGHEVGHTVGLRHNFQASMDPLNYRPEFWWLENDDGTITQYWNNTATENNRHRGNEYKYASIMDYGFGVALEGIHGLGSYDAAAIRFMYGQIVDVWDPAKVSVPDPRKYRSFARRCGHDSDFLGLPSLLFWLGPDNLAKVLSQPAANVQDEMGNPIDCASIDQDTNPVCDSALDTLYRELVNRMENIADQNNFISECAIFTQQGVADLNELLERVQEIEPNAANIYAGRKMVGVEDMITQQIEVLTNPPEYDDPATDKGQRDPATGCVPGDESLDCMDSDGDGVVDDKGHNWNSYLYQVDYSYCSDLYAGFSIPFCQRWDTGWDFEEATQAHINRYDRDYVFDHFRRDALSGWGNPRSYVARLQSRRFYHMTNVFRYFLFTRRSAFDFPVFEDWREAAYRGLNFLERVIQTPEPGTYCLNAADNRYELQTDPNGACDSPYEVGLGYGEGKYLETAWTNEYFYKPNRLGAFYDKLAAVAQMTSSSGRFVRNLSDLFNRRAFSLGYLRVYLDPMVQRYAALISGNHEGYRPRVVTDDDGERFVRYTPFFDEELSDGSSVREWLDGFPEIEPAWSYSLQYYSMAYALANWSSVNDYAPEFYRFTKISIKGTPGDVEYPASFNVVEFTDPETFITYRAPTIEPFSPGGLVQEFPAYYGDAFHRRQGRFRNWSVGSNLLDDANTYLTESWQPAKDGCDNGTNVGPGDRWETQEDACNAFARSRNVLSEKVGYINRVLRFSQRAEYPF